MKRFNTLTIAIMTILSLGAMESANAGGLAYSSLDISNFQLYQGDSTTAAAQWSFNDFSTIAIANDAESHATITGFPNSDHTQPPTSGNISLTQSYTGLAGGNPDNTYTQTPISPLLLFSRADADLNGAIISDVPGGIANSSTANNVSEQQVGVDQQILSSGTSSARIGTASGFTFTLAQPGGLFDFRFNATGNLETFLDKPQFSSRADYNFNINIKDLSTGATIFNWTPSNSITGGTVIAEAFNMNDGCSVVGLALPIKCQVNNPLGYFEAITTVALGINIPYQLTIQHKTSTSLDVNQVPEPGILSLLGAGLFGIGTLRKRAQSILS